MTTRAAPPQAAVPRHPPANTDLIYHQTIIPTQKITHCAVGSFTLPGATDFAVVRHDTLELWTLHVDRNAAECVHSTRLFANVYQVAAVPTSTTAAAAGRGSAGILDAASTETAAMHRLAVTSETGCLVLLRYDLDEPPVPARLAQDPTSGSQHPNDVDNDDDDDDAEGLRGAAAPTSLRGRFVRVSEVALGRSGARVTVPGARLAVDPLGRAVFAAALMRLKVLVPLRKHEGYDALRRGGALHDDGEDELLAPSSSALRGAAAGPEGAVAPKKRRPAVRDVLSFGSPVEAHRQTIIFALCALEGATENATFATLEQEIHEAQSAVGEAAAAPSVGAGQAFLRVNPGAKLPSQGGGGGVSRRSKQLVVYAFVAGLQQVQRTHLVSVPATAHRLIAVPASPAGPGGVIVCTDAELVWYDLLPQLHGDGVLGSSSLSDPNLPLPPAGLSAVSLFKTAAPFPRRNDFREQLYDPMIIAHAMTCVRNDFFMLLQDDQGDVFRVSLTVMDVQRAYDALRMRQQQQRMGAAAAAVPPVTVPSPLTVSYFDTLPPTTAMALFRRGFVFAASESAPTHGLYKIVKDGYRTDAEYILTRMRMVDQRHGRPDDGYEEDAKGGAPQPPQPPPSPSSSVAAAAEAGEDGTGASGGMALMPPPPPLAKGPAVLLPPPSSLQRTQQLQQPKGRVVPLFIPHPSLRHMVLLETYPSTPAITSLVVTIPQQTQDAEVNQERQPHHLHQKQQQPHVQIDALVGRGSDSVLLHARYGYAARLESSFTLPAVFSHLTPLTSATAMQQRWREAQLEAKKRSGGGSYRHAAKTPSRLPGNLLWDDKLLLSTRQGTTVLSLALTGQVEPDTLSGFVTSEHTIAAGTLHCGVGYVQITPSCIVVLPQRVEQQQQQGATVSTTPVAESVTWMHPHGKRILAAAVAGNTMVVSFAQGGGIASFDMGMRGTRLQQLEAIPSFPHTPAISLLRDPDAESRHFTASMHASAAALAAIATASHEVYIVNPKRLREPLETIRCTSDDVSGGAPPAIVSVLLTYLGRTSGVRRLFCFIGHMDGTVTRCELDTATYKAMDRAVLTCGSAPCQMIAGDGERACYVLCGEFNWRCDVRDGLPKTVPWRFPAPQVMYASFRRPPIARAAATTEVEVSTGAREELVLGVAGNTLSLFAAQQSGGTSTAETSLEYSFGHTQLSVAGRRLLQHPTRAEYLIVIGTEHRGYGVAALRRAAAAAAAAVAEQQRRRQGNTTEAGEGSATKDENAAGAKNTSGGGIPLDKPQRSLNHADHYVSTLQLYNKRTDRLDPPLYFQEREAVLSAAVGSFVKDFGKEPVVVAGCAEQYTHGSGCGVGPAWTQGRLRAFRFVVSQSSMPGGGGATPVLRLEQLHDTPITAAETGGEGGAGGVAASYRTTPLMDYPSALHICPEVGLLFVGLGPENGLQVYAWGQRRFLRKRRLPNVPSRITAIETVFVSPPGAASSTAAASNAAPDLFRCGPNSGSLARDKRLLIVCGTLDQSVFIATVQPGSGTAGSMSFLMLVARDAVPRSVTSIVCVDERTVAVADRFGSVAFLRLPRDARLGFAEPLHHMSDAELMEVERYAAHEQVLQEIAVHHTGQLVTALRVHDYDPSGGADPSLALRILFYATALGSVGAYTPFVREEDAALAAHLQPLIAAHIRCPLQDGSGCPPYNAAGRLTASAAAAVSPSPVHNVVEGDLAQLLLHASTSLFSTEAKTDVEAELARRERAEAAQRNVLGLPPRSWPALAELVAKHRALVTLPP
ncbi:splicing factor 3B subunit 3 [Trypanosoma conorhini]|uniref:Splicing factor 3B subunit 3 n=1 Tax=Trypanosoma conorhini TaxID=83891 RepID=A0A422Q7R8_9TRYP|nr:splicing factor 3B subunit 3 [Trypanosoma conorhini]RNF26012.1 splicing factor 3B subunit 3 [Trypanosoma conorhini]